MGAYAALLSLSHTLEQILFLDQYPLLFEKHKLVSLHGNLATLIAFLDEYSIKYKGGVNPLESRIIDAAYRAEDIVESQLACVYSAASENALQLKRESLELSSVLEEIDSILKEVLDVMANEQAVNVTSTEFSGSASLSTVVPSDGDTTVGLDDDFMAIKGRMYQQSSTFQATPIFGMGGIGKTTLARRLYVDSFKMQYFDRCIWIVVSQDYSLRKILLGILRSLKKPTDEKFTDGELVQIVHQELFGRRYLVVADDVWSEEAWDHLNRVLPKATKGSQVLVTTRLQNVAAYVASSSSLLHEIHFLSDDQSWRLLEVRVFGKSSCPSQMETIGKKIAKYCRGLPLMIVVIAGVLKENITTEYWSDTLQEISSGARANIAVNCSNVLSLSYDRLPLYLKPCFLYSTVFPEDYEIKVNRLVGLWMAEGFVKPRGSKCLEEVANEYLDDLVERSLIIVSKRKYGKTKAVKIHDSLRDIGKLKAQRERFHHHDHQDCRWDGTQRRVTTDHDYNACDTSKFHTTLTRSILMPYSGVAEPPFENFKLLRVLLTNGSSLPELNAKEWVLLRYLAIVPCTGYGLENVWKLQSLQTLQIIRVGRGVSIPLKIWKMSFLRHIIVMEDCDLIQPSKFEVVDKTNLQTLSTARNWKITAQTIKLLVNVRKLGLSYRDQHDLDNLQLSNLVHLQKLEELKIIWTCSQPWGKPWRGIPSVKLVFPCTLTKLNWNCHGGPWEDMNIVGALPNLEALKLRHTGVLGGEWNPVEGQFLKLKYLELDSVNLNHWGAENMY